MSPRVWDTGQQARERGGQHQSSEDKPSGGPSTRMTINIGPETEAALRTVIAAEGITLTEAVRRLVGYGDLVFRAIRLDGKDILIRHAGETQQVILV